MTRAGECSYFSITASALKPVFVSVIGVQLTYYYISFRTVVGQALAFLHKVAQTCLWLNRPLLIEQRLQMF